MLPTKNFGISAGVCGEGSLEDFRGREVAKAGFRKISPSAAV
jgi:hypothetical protein